jgi:hypothetical protein
MRHELIGRIGKHGGRGYDGYENQSRDAALIIPCSCTVCPVNSSAHCSMPSKMRINAAGVCMTGLEFKAKPAITAPRLVCKWCGSRIIQNDNPDGPKYLHPPGEKLSHPAEPRNP